MLVTQTLFYSYVSVMVFVVQQKLFEGTGHKILYNLHYWGASLYTSVTVNFEANVCLSSIWEFSPYCKQNTAHDHFKVQQVNAFL
jgi:hypothetical protein